jgi:serine/threonine-protein kinase
LGGVTFTMGSSAPNLGTGFADHTPPHSVKLDQYFLDAHEVTVARYRVCVDAGACSAPAGSSGFVCTYTAVASDSEELPVNCVDWERASKFCEWDGNRRLPTEAEWELAARGTTERTFPWGEQFSCARVVAGSSKACPEYRGPLPVGSSAEGASPEGVFDLAGNVAEWVMDRASRYPATLVTNPTGGTTSRERIVRGGQWSSLPTQVNGYVRTSSLPTVAGARGFRCARTP